MAASDHASQQHCPSCLSPIRTTPTEHYCPHCGHVIEDSPIDHGPDYRIYDATDRRQKERHHPGDRNRKDNGLGSIMGYHDERDADAERLRTWHHRVTAGSKQDRNKDYATTEISRIVAALKLDDTITEQATQLFRNLHDDDLHGYDLDTIAATVAYIVARIHQRGVTPAEVAAVARTDRDTLLSRYRQLKREENIPVPPPDPRQRVRIVAREAGVSDDDREAALSWVDGLDPTVHSRGSPSTLAALAVYRASELSQEAAADAAGCTAAAIRDRANAIESMGGQPSDAHAD